MRRKQVAVPNPANAAPVRRMDQNHQRQTQRLGLLFCAGFAAAFAVAAIVIGPQLDHLDVGFSVGPVETTHQRLEPGDRRFGGYQLLFIIAMALVSLICTGFAWHFWRALRKTG